MLTDEGLNEALNDDPNPAVRQRLDNDSNGRWTRFDSNLLDRSARQLLKLFKSTLAELRSALIDHFLE